MNCVVLVGVRGDGVVVVDGVSVGVGVGGGEEVGVINK